MARVALAKQIMRFHELHSKKKEVEAELDALKEQFRERAGSEDAVFEAGDLQVPVTWKERTGWDGAKLELELAEKAAAFKKTSRYAEVSCRKKETVA